MCSNWAKSTSSSKRRIIKLSQILNPASCTRAPIKASNESSKILLLFSRPLFTSIYFDISIYLLNPIVEHRSANVSLFSIFVLNLVIKPSS